MIVRRRILLGLLTAAFAPIGSLAQQPGVQPRIGWISTETQPDPFVDGFREGLLKHGYVDGRNVALELRYAPGNPDGLRAMISELLQMNPAFIVSSGPAIRAIRTAKNVPVLFAISGDPVELGIAESLARPGGNFTGATFLSLEIAGKRLELLKEGLPEIRNVAVLSNADHPGERSEWRATENAAQVLGIRLTYVPFVGAGELDSALAAVRDAAPDAMLVFPEGVTMVQRAKIATFATAHRLPSMFGWGEYCDAGGLMCYGANQRQTYVRLAAFADKLLRGARPAELPIEQPTRFELVLNMGTAKLLGVALPQSFQPRADRLIE